MALLVWSGATWGMGEMGPVEANATPSFREAAVSINGNTGSATSEYSFALPPARGRYQPTLKLGYLSGRGIGAGGVGWQLYTNSISLVPHGTLSSAGVQRDQYQLNWNGASLLLIPDGTLGEYRPEVASSYLVAKQSGGQWLVVDAVGTTYTFMPDLFANSWLLSRVADVDGNYTDYLYTTVLGQSQLDRIQYDYYDPQNANNLSSPLTISGALPLVVVQLSYQDTTYSDVSVVRGKLFQQSKLLSSVSVNRQNLSRTTQSLNPLYVYTAGYISSSFTSRPLLSSISAAGTDGITTSFLQFSYTAGSLGWQSNATTIGAPTGGSSPTPAQLQQWFSFNNGMNNVNSHCILEDGRDTISQTTDLAVLVTWVDLDGDGLPDAIFGDGVTGIVWSRNIGSPQTGPVLSAWTSIPSSVGKLWSDFGARGQAKNGRVNSVHWAGDNYYQDPQQPALQPPFTTQGTKIMDVDGDGLPDIVGTSAACGAGAFSISFNRGMVAGQLTFSDALCVPVPGAFTDASSPLGDWASVTGLAYLQTDVATPIVDCTSQSKFVATLVDLTGDGVADLVLISTNGWHVYPGYITAKTSGTSSGMTFASTRIPGFAGFKGDANLIDVNGDGTPDNVTIAPDAAVSSLSTPAVFFNTGASLELAPAGSTNLAGWVALNSKNNGQGQMADLYRTGRPGLLAGHEPNNPTCTTDPGAHTFWYYPQIGLDMATTATQVAGLGSSTNFCDQGLPTYFNPLYLIAPQWGSQPTFFNAALVDVDGDGAVDYVVANADAHTWTWYRSAQYLEPPPDLLRNVITSLGKSTTLSYSVSSQFGVISKLHPYPVVRDVTVQGPGLADLHTRYWYSSPAMTPLWSEANKFEYLGFATTWSQDDATLVVVQNSWGQSHSTKGLLRQSTSAPPQDGTFGSTLSPPNQLKNSQGTPEPAVVQSHQPSAKSVNDTGGRCNLEPSVPATYPVILFDGASFQGQQVAGAMLGRSTQINCVDVDTFGNVLKVSTSVDGGQTAVQHANFAISSQCPSCVTERWVDSGEGTAELSHSIFHYDALPGTYEPGTGAVSSGHLNYVEERTSAQSTAADVEVKRAFSANGNISSMKRVFAAPGGTVTTTLFYDPSQTTVEIFQNADAQTTLIHELRHERKLGLLSAEVGPYLQGGVAGAPTKYYSFDGGNRLIAVSLSAPVQNSQGLYLSSPTIVHSYTYATPVNSIPGFPKPMQPASVTTYSFASVKSFYYPSVPAQDDVTETRTYFDRDGKNTAHLRRLAQGAPADSQANVQGAIDSSMALVESAVYKDGAGREIATFAPFYAQYSIANNSLNYGFPAGKNAVSTQYDTLGRVSCKTVHPVGTSYVAPTDCRSNLTTDDTSYRRATAYTYGIGQPDGAATFLAYDIIPDWANSGASASPPPAAPQKGAHRYYLDGAGREQYAVDAYGNTRQTILDPLGREIAALRWVGTSRITTVQRTLDLRGRITDQVDVAKGYEHFAFLPTGELGGYYHAPNQSAAADSGAEYYYGSLGRLTSVARYKWVQTTSGWQKQYDQAEVTTLKYDVNPPDGYNRNFLAGRMVSAENGVSRKTFSYRYDGLPEFTTQVISGDAGVNTTFLYRLDGRETYRAYGAGATSSNVVVQTYYDSFGRATKLVSGGSDVWSVGASGTMPATGWYDSWGRLTAATANNGALVYSKQFSSNTGLVTSAVSLQSGTPLLSTSYSSYSGSRLSASAESVSQSNFAYTYDDEGRLADAEASAPKTSIGQQFSALFSFALDHSFSSSSSNVPSGLTISATQVTTSNGTDSSIYSYLPGAPDSLSTVTASGPTAVPRFVSYDTNGKGLVVAEATVANALPALHRFAYDVDGHLTSIARFGQVKESLAYGPEGQLARRTFTGGPDASRFYYDDDVTVVHEAAAVVAYFHIGRDERIASVWNKLVGTTATSGVLFYHRDRQHSVAAVSNDSGSQAVQYRYDAYGALERMDGQESDGLTSDLGYAGGLRLSEGLVLFGDRTYSPGLRQFLQPDCEDPIRYRYVDGDPINYRDPTGSTGQGVATTAGGASSGGSGGGWFGSNDVASPTIATMMGSSSLLVAATIQLPSPQLPSPRNGLLNLLRGIEVHQAFGMEFMKSSRAGRGVRFVDQTINTLLEEDGILTPVFGGYWRPDYVSLSVGRIPATAEVYELKPASVYGFGGAAQLGLYLSVLQGYNPARIYMRGSTWTPPKELPLSGGARARFIGPYDGVIYYEVEDPNTSNGKLAVMTAAQVAALIAVILASIRGGRPGLVPVP